MCCATLDWICVAISSVATIEFVGNGLNLVWLLNLAWQSYLTEILFVFLKVFEGIFFNISGLNSKTLCLNCFLYWKNKYKHHYENKKLNEDSLKICVIFFIKRLENHMTVTNHIKSDSHSCVIRARKFNDQKKPLTFTYVSTHLQINLADAQLAALQRWYPLARILEVDQQRWCVKQFQYFLDFQTVWSLFDQRCLKLKWCFVEVFMKLWIKYGHDFFSFGRFKYYLV